MVAKARSEAQKRRNSRAAVNQKLNKTARVYIVEHEREKETGHKA